MIILDIFKILFKRKLNGYYFLAKILMWVAVPLLATPWYLPLITPTIKEYFGISIDDDPVFWIGLSCLVLGILSAIYGLFKDKQIKKDTIIKNRLDSILTESQMLNLISYFRNNAHIEKSDWSALNMYYSELSLESNKFTHYLIRFKVKKFIKSVNKLFDFTTYKINDLKYQTTRFHYFRPDWNTDLSNSASTENQTKFDREFEQLTKHLKFVEKKYKSLLNSMRKKI